jgi:biotin-[acetyl-CoA-carboxylase] ligase BirA-like protein
MTDDFRFQDNAMEVHGFHCYRFESLNSTQALLREWVNRGSLASGTVIIAKGQTHGRGRLGHSWVSLPGKGLWMSAYLRPCIPSELAFVWNMDVALAVCKALDAVAPWVEWYIKWPNDWVTKQGRKVGGMLVENQLRGSMITESLVGIGINVSRGAVDSGLPFATSLMGEFKSTQAEDQNQSDTLTENLLHVTLAALESILHRSGNSSDHPTGEHSAPQSGDWNTSNILSEAENRLFGLGQRLPFECEGRTEFWIPVGLDQWGGLRVRSGAEGSSQTLIHPHYRMSHDLNL